MKLNETPSLFAADEMPDAARIPEPAFDLNAPLAERMRPRSLEEFVGQEHLVGAGRPLRQWVGGAGALPSIILWGAPGTGKTTLARIMARNAKANFIALSAVFSGVKEIRAGIQEARVNRRLQRRTILFIDEIHRFNKAQQDALLPAVEDGTVTLIGATTENPSFEVNGALLSRCRVLTLNALGADEIELIIQRALEDKERGLGAAQIILDDKALPALTTLAGGDARVALSALEAAVNAAPTDENGKRALSADLIRSAFGRAQFAFDKGGEEHYNLASALIKSVRNSDANAALYWLARLIAGGADPMFVARRLCILASEDIGLADPSAITQANAAAQITHLIGLPEALYPLAQAAVYLARAPKSNQIKVAFQAAMADAVETAREPVPLHLRNAVTPLMKNLSYGAEYRYVHNDAGAQREMRCLPETLEGKIYWHDNDE